MNLNALVASRIKDLRNQKGYKAEIVAKELQMSKTAYSQLENGKVDIPLSRVDQIADYYTVPISAILQDNNGAIFNIEKIENSTINGTQNNYYQQIVSDLEKSAETSLRAAEHFKKGM